MPAVLIEYGFHTSKDDVELLQSSAYRDKLAIATARAVCDYLKKPWREVGKKYVVTVAAFTSRASAQAVVDKLKEIGISATIKEE